MSSGLSSFSSRRRRALGPATTDLLRIASALLGCSVLLGCSAAGAGTLHGTVRFEGSPPVPPTVYMSTDPACDRLYPKGRPAETVVVGPTGGLANAIVHVKSGLPKEFRAPSPGGSVKLDQVGCAFAPHVLAVRTGQEIEIHNGDDTYHNVNARTGENTPFNDAMPAKGLLLRKAFSRPEVAVKLKCDIHPWMSAYIGVFDHPFYAVTLPDGAFEFVGLPEGRYTIEAWHESLGTQSAVVEIDADEPRTIGFRFAGN